MEPTLTRFPCYFQNYVWDSKHKLFGYPEDRFGGFEWIASLERRFGWLKSNSSVENTASIFLIEEMIQWGGDQNGVSRKFSDGLEGCNLIASIQEVIKSLPDTKDSIASALKIPGLGLTYASKMLRFFDPENFGALDGRIRKALKKYTGMPTVYDGNNPSMERGYVWYIQYLQNLQQQLDAQQILRPECALPLGQSPSGWRIADIEMALFTWANTPAICAAASGTDAAEEASSGE